MVRSDIAALRGYVPGEQPPPGKYIKLNTNENPYPPSSRVLAAIQEAAKSLSRYPDPMATAMRQQISPLTGYSTQHILCGNGSDDLLTILIRTFVAGGETLRTLSPSYILYETLAQLQGAHCDMVKYTSDWGLPEAFVRPDPKLRLAIVANPNSPSGTCISPEILLEAAEALPCPLVIDEAYVDFADRNCLELVAQSPKILVMRSLSKSYSLAGLRCGYLVAHPELIAELAKMKDSYNCGVLSIAGATAALADTGWLQTHISKIQATRERCAITFRELGLHVTPSQANFLWCTRPAASQLPPLQLLFEQLKARQILVRYMPYAQWGDGLRITIGTDEQMDAALSVLRSILHDAG